MDIYDHLIYLYMCFLNYTIKFKSFSSTILAFFYTYIFMHSLTAAIEGCLRHCCSRISAKA